MAHKPLSQVDAFSLTHLLRVNSELQLESARRPRHADDSVANCDGHI